MDLTPWAPAIALGGVALGSVVTFVGQSLTRRQASALSIEEQKAALRNDRRDAIYQFIKAAESVDTLASTQNPEERPNLTDLKTDVETELWYRQRCIDVVCRREVRVAAQHYTVALLDILWGGIPAGVKLREHVARHEDAFLDLARTELYAPKISD